MVRMAQTVASADEMKLDRVLDKGSGTDSFVAQDVDV